MQSLIYNLLLCLLGSSMFSHKICFHECHLLLCVVAYVNVIMFTGSFNIVCLFKTVTVCLCVKNKGFHHTLVQTSNIWNLSTNRFINTDAGRNCWWVMFSVISVNLYELYITQWVPSVSCELFIGSKANRLLSEALASLKLLLLSSISSSWTFCDITGLE